MVRPSDRNTNPFRTLEEIEMLEKSVKYVSILAAKTDNPTQTTKSERGFHQIDWARTKESKESKGFDFFPISPLEEYWIESNFPSENVFKTFDTDDLTF